MRPHMGVLSSAWCPGGRTTAKPFCRHREERGDQSAGLTTSQHENASASLLTFSSRVATLKTSSATDPTARRAALEEWTSFQMVSLST